MPEYDMSVLDAVLPVEEQQRLLRAAIARHLPAPSHQPRRPAGQLQEA